MKATLDNNMKLVYHQICHVSITDGGVNKINYYIKMSHDTEISESVSRMIA